MFDAAYCIDESKIQNLYWICSNGYTQGAKEQASAAMSRAGRNESLGRKQELETDTLWLS